MSVPKVIVVDDDPITRMDLKEMLLAEGYDVIGEGKNGEEAVELCFKYEPDLAVMDVKMPVLNGIKASHIIRQQTTTAILLLTAYSQKELVKEARKSGVTAYLVKPVSEEDLIPAIEIALSQRERFQCLTKDIEMLKKKIEERKHIEKAKGKIMQIHSLTEEEAYRYLRKTSMEKRLSMLALADLILSGDDFSIDKELLISR